LVNPSLTQNAKQSPVATEVLITLKVLSTPVFGKAEESVDDAPTHHTLLLLSTVANFGGPLEGVVCLT
jgi:hypothetical protein